MDRKRSNLAALYGANLTQVRVVEKLMFVELVFNIGQRELCAPDRNIQFAENPRKRSDMVFMSVCEHDAAHILTIFQQVRNVGEDDIDAPQLGFGEHKPGIDDDDVIAVAYGHAVHTELAHTAQRNNMQFSWWHYLSRCYHMVCRGPSYV